MRRSFAARAGAVVALGLTTALAIGTTAPAGAAPSAELFDDFTYAGPDDSRIAARNWTVRTGGGGPGVPGAVWAKENVAFPAIDSGKALELKASYDGTTTRQSEVYHQRKFFEGTYAARVRFTDAPLSGPDGDQLVQTFFTITPLDAPLDPDYGELDFEYLPNGGWGETGPTMFTTTWETYQADPWIADNISTKRTGSLAGWHDLVIQVSGGRAIYYLDGAEFANHGDKYYPETPMSINLNHWFISGGQVSNPTPRAYVEQIDYVYFSRNEVVAPAEVGTRVQAFRSAAVDWKDTVTP
ncbi:glycoside hydrolase family 16 protein [Flindersiella endophytica]